MDIYDELRKKALGGDPPGVNQPEVLQEALDQLKADRAKLAKLDEKPMARHRQLLLVRHGQRVCNRLVVGLAQTGRMHPSRADELLAEHRLTFDLRDN